MQYHVIDLWDISRINFITWFIAVKGNLEIGVRKNDNSDVSYKHYIFSSLGPANVFGGV